MRIGLASSLSFGLACVAVVGSIQACGGSTDGGVDPGKDGDGGLPDAADAAPPLDARSDAPPVPGELSLFGTYAVQKMFLGETNRAGVPTKDAWKQYGENIDGLVTTKSSTDVCKRRGGADSAKQEDGIGGIDNAFGRTVLGFILGLVPTPTKTTNEAIAAGGRTMMFSLMPKAGATPARAGFFTAAATTTIPLFDGTDTRAAAASSVGAGPGDPLGISTTPRSTGFLVTSGIATGTFAFELPIQGIPWRMPINGARMSMTLSPDRLRGTNGVIAGVIPTDDLVAGIELVAGRISTQLCGGSTLDTIKETIRQASDILVDGTQDPTKECNGVSIGIGFEAVAVTASGVQAEPPPAPDPCL